MKSIQIILLFTITVLTTQASIAGHVLPIFTGKFVGEYPEEINQDNCGALHINYANTNSDYMEILKGQFNETPWGVAYGLVGMKFPLEMEMAKSVLIEGQNQQRYKPEYPTIPIYHEGSDEIGDRGRFRCDTFIYFSYLKALKYSIDWNCIAPNSLYRAFIIPREDVALKVNSKWDNLIDKKVLTERNREETDKLFRKFTLSNDISRLDKMHQLLKWASDLTTDFQYSYFMQSLGYLKPYEHIPDLIDKYNAESDVHKKEIIISTIRDALLIKKEKPTLASHKNIIDGEHFLIRLLQTENNAQLLNHVISSAYIAINRDTYLIITEAMRRLNTLPGDKYHLSLEEQDMEIIKMLFASKDVQYWQLEKWLKQQQTQEQRKYAYKSLTSLISYKVTPNRIDDRIKPVLKEFIIKNKLILENDTIFDEAENEGKYQYALATVATTSPEERDTYLLRVIRDERDDVMQAKYIYGIRHFVNNENVIDKLNEEERKKIMDKFHHKFVDTNDPQLLQLFASIDGVLTLYKK